MARNNPNIDGMDDDALRSLLSSLMSKKVGPARPVSKDAKEKANPSAVMIALLQKYLKDFRKEAEEDQALLKEVVESIKDLENRRDAKKQENKEKTKDKKSSVLETKNSKNIYAIHKMLTKASKNDSGDTIKLLQEINNNIKNGGGGGNGGGNPPTPSASGGGGGGAGRRKGLFGNNIRYIDGQPVADDLAIMSHFIEHITAELSHVEKHLVGFNAISVVFDGIIDKERQFVQDMRQIAYETNFSTKEAYALNKAYEDIGTTSFQTGVAREDFQESYKKSIRGGIRDLKIVNSLTKTQLHTEKQLGMKAGELNDEFTSWNQSGRMTVAQLDEMGRGIREVGRNTGLTGDELGSVVKNSGDFVQSLKNAAMFSSETSTNMLEISANAKKLGIESQIQPLLKAMSSSSHLLLEASSQTQTLLFSAASKVGKIDDLLNGTIGRSKAGIKSMAMGIDAVLKDFGVSSMESIDQLSDAAKKQLNLSLKATFGLELGELRSQYEALNEAGKSYTDRLNGIEEKRKNNLTLEESSMLLEEERRLKLNKSMEMLTIMDEAAKGAKDMNMALATFGKRKNEFSEDLTKMGISAKDNAGIVKGSIEAALKSVNEGLSSSGKETLNISSKDIENALKDPKALRELTSQITKAEQVSATAMKSQLTPMEEMNQNLTEINDNIRKYTNHGISGLFNSVLGKLVALTSAVVGIGGGLALFYYGMRRKYDTIERMFLDEETGTASWLKKMFNKSSSSTPANTTNFKVGKMQDNPNSAYRKLKTKVTYKDAASKDMGTFYKSLSKRLSESLESFGNGIAETTEKLSKFITNGTESLVKEITTSGPKKAYLDLINKTWNEVAKATEHGMGRVKTVFNQVTKFSSINFNKLTTQSSAFYKNLKIAEQIPKLRSAMSFTAIKTFVKDIPVLAAKGFGGGLNAMVKIYGKVGSSFFRLAATMNPLSLAITGIFVAIDGLTGALDAGARAGKIFNKAQENVTLNEEYSAKAAGLLFGVLNGLTFGIAGLLLPLDKWTDSLARFNAKIPILTIILAPLIVALEVAWGIIKGVGLAIWDIFKGLWKMVTNIVNPIVDGLAESFSILGGIFGETDGKANWLVQTFRKMGGVVGIVSGTIRFIGTAIGWVFSTLGATIGFAIGLIMKLANIILTVLIWPIKLLIKTIDWISGLFGAFIDGFKGIMSPFSEAWDLFSMAFSEIGTAFSDIGTMFSDIGSAIYGIISPIIEAIDVFGFFKEGTGGMTWVLKEAAQAITSIIKLFLNVILTPLRIFAFVISSVGKTIQSVIKILQGDFSGAFKLFSSIFTDGMKFIINPFKEFGMWLYNNTIGAFIDIGAGIGTFVYNTLMYPFVKIADFLMNLIPGLGKGVEAFTATEEANKKRVAENGSSFTGGIGRTLGGMKDLSLSKTLGGVGELALASLGLFNPFNYFEDGTRKVQQTGIGFLHKNEMIVPANDVQNLSAKGDGKFEANEFLSNAVERKDRISTSMTSAMPPMDIHSAVQRDRAAKDTEKTEIISSEIDNISSEASEQTILLSKLTVLFEQMLKALDPQSQPNRSGGGAVGNTSPKQVVHKPANYFRNTVGLVSQTASKSALNLGPQTS